MERQGRIAVFGAVMALAAMILTGCTTEKQTEAVRGTQRQSGYDAEKTDSSVTPGNGSYGPEGISGDGKQGGTQEASQKVTEEAGRAATEEAGRTAAQEADQTAAEEDPYRPLMQAAAKAIEADDAGALYELQESQEAKLLGASVRDGGHYVYFLDGADSGKGIGFYTFQECSCKQWYYGDYKDGKREGSGIWYYVSASTGDGSLYKEVYSGGWKEDAPNGKGRQLAAQGDSVDTDQRFKVKKGLFYGTYKIKDRLEDGTAVKGKYKLRKGKYVTISDEELEANNFEVPQEPHLAIAFLYDKDGAVKSCSMVYAEDVTKGVKHFY